MDPRPRVPCLRINRAEAHLALKLPVIVQDKGNNGRQREQTTPGDMTLLGAIALNSTHSPIIRHWQRLQ